MAATVTHEMLRKAAFACLRRAHTYLRREASQVGFGCSLVVSELVTAAYEIPDAIGWRYGRSVLIECKVSRSDFLADAKKPHRISGTGMGERRYFLVPAGLLTVADLPPMWGLLEFREGKVYQVHDPEWSGRSVDFKGHCDEKRVLLSLVSRIKMREFLFVSSERMDAELCAEEQAVG